MNNKKKLSLFCFIILDIMCTTIHAQTEFCMRFTDTVNLQARLITLRFAGVNDSPHCYFIVSNDEEKKDAVNRYMLGIPPRQDQLYLISHLSVNQFLAIKKIIEDSLYDKFSLQEISDMLVSCSESNSLPPDIINDEDKLQNGKFVYVAPNSFYFPARTKLILQLSDEDCKQKKTSRKATKLWTLPSIKRSARIYYEVCDASFESWGVILEVSQGCDFFFSNDYESHYLNNNFTLKLFIPLSLKK
ncbi:MAG: hypothetical protein IJT51_09115 [Bacteroidales bacterium]|nr:hypothetical protein [Bacteroidales bacterium]